MYTELVQEGDITVVFGHEVTTLPGRNVTIHTFPLWKSLRNLYRKKSDRD
jgi:hypothetical protein